MRLQLNRNRSFKCETDMRAKDRFTQSERTRLRSLVNRAYERELTEALGDVMAGVDDIRAGRINVFDLSDLIHEFHNGAARDLWKLYDGVQPQLLVVSALKRGYLEAKEVPKRLLGKLPLDAL